ncbi:hypothetical protein ABT263_18765 [Kitasatospora sp. NPDC001603]|uniref:hypothetical protein n=1 Tax=Kitasatospora sp. NPDC001603 TaxID=3154388 RepID=UPI00332377F9
MARRGGDLEAFTAFLGGMLAAGAAGLALVGADALIEPGPWLRKAAPVVVAVLWLTVTVGLYRWLGAAARTGWTGARAPGPGSRPAGRDGHRAAHPRPAGADRAPARRPGRGPASPVSPRSPGRPRARRRGPAR